MRSATLAVPSEQEQRIEAVLNLDFALLRRKLALPEPEGREWTEEQAALAELWYRRFLILNLLYPDHPHVPNDPIDTFWHAHILWTERYGTDCMEIFGSFMHHYPFFGLNGDEVERDAAFDETNRLYRLHFGEDCTAMGRSFFKTMQGSGCNHSGSGTGCGQGCGRGG